MRPLRPLPGGPVIAWYGDDFTGSAAVLEVLAFAGMPSVLFLAPPDAELRARFPEARGIGVAGDARSRDPAWMSAHLPGIFASLRAMGAAMLHYKTCSTFDSAPHVGSIGRAAEIGLGPEGWAPLLLGAPAIGRYQAFGNLFATAGPEAARIDRHPTMAHHPVTPMDEADVRLHLARQTELEMGLVDLVALGRGAGAARLQAERARGARVIAFDVVDEATLAEAGRVIWQAAPGFALGSQGLEYALVAAWKQAGLLPASGPAAPLAPAGRIAVVSGSCAPVTAEQIAVAEAAGFRVVALDAALAVDPPAWEAECSRGVAAALAALGEGASPILYTARGPGDPALEAVAAARARSGRDAGEMNAEIGRGLGEALAAIVRASGLGRVAIAGGDTSSNATGALGIAALTAAAPAGAGAPLLHGHTADEGRAPLEIALKGGQMGPPDFFLRLRDGGEAASETRRAS